MVLERLLVRYLTNGEICRNCAERLLARFYIFITKSAISEQNITSIAIASYLGQKLISDWSTYQVLSHKNSM